MGRRKKETPSVRKEVQVPAPLIEKIEALIKKGYYKDIQDFILDAIRHRIEEYEEKRPELFSEL